MRVGGSLSVGDMLLLLLLSSSDESDEPVEWHCWSDSSTPDGQSCESMHAFNSGHQVEQKNQAGACCGGDDETEPR
ncbi:hypothetical protein OUZ56_031294 [Daphnia magna]|uniref:Secreted protein n=1 Tax=Daphnia magna TaxID=35525 RepID=A0ABQ9ZU83_9CRUS|nr:hypothetical protein OUZ56_031294 [Daphnia magna]